MTPTPNEPTLPGVDPPHPPVNISGFQDGSPQPDESGGRDVQESENVENVEAG